MLSDVFPAPKAFGAGLTERSSMFHAAQEEIYPDKREAKRWNVRHEGAAGKNVQRRETVEKRRPNGCCAAEHFPDEQKEKRQRDSEENYGLATAGPFVNARKFVANCRNKRQNRKFRSDVAGRIASPVDLRISKAKSSFAKVSCNRRDVALPPTPVIDVRLIDENQASRHGENPQAYYELGDLVTTARRAKSVRGVTLVSWQRSASPLRSGERIEVRGFSHGVTIKKEPSPYPLPSRRSVCFAPKVLSLSHPSLGHRPRNSNRHVNKRCKRSSIERADRTGAGSESRFQRWHFLGAPNPGALPQVRHGESVLWRTGAEHVAPLALHTYRKERREMALTSGHTRALVWTFCKRLDSQGKVNRVQ